MVFVDFGVYLRLEFIVTCSFTSIDTINGISRRHYYVVSTETITCGFVEGDIFAAVVEAVSTLLLRFPCHANIVRSYPDSTRTITFKWHILPLIKR